MIIFWYEGVLGMRKRPFRNSLKIHQICYGWAPLIMGWLIWRQLSPPAGRTHCLVIASNALLIEPKLFHFQTGTDTYLSFWHTWLSLYIIRIIVTSWTYVPLMDFRWASISYSETLKDIHLDFYFCYPWYPPFSLQSVVHINQTSWQRMFWLQHLRYEALIKLTTETSWLRYPWILVAQIPSKIIVRLSCHVDYNVDEVDDQTWYLSQASQAALV